MSRLRYNGLAEAADPLTLGASLTNSGTTITFPNALKHSGGTAVPTLAAGEYIPLSIIDPATETVSEVVWLTAYTAGATTGTITRGQEGTTGVAHSSGDAVVHGPTAFDASYHGVKVYRSAAYTYAAGAVTAVPWDAEEWDTDGFHDNATNNTRLTVPTGLAGKYRVSAALSSDVLTGGRFLINIMKNGSTNVRGGVFDLETSNYQSMAVTCEVDLAATDYIESKYYAANSKGMDESWSAFSMHKIG